MPYKCSAFCNIIHPAVIINAMIPDKLLRLLEKHGETETYGVGEVFHAQDFPDKLFLLKKGYVKRYQATDPDHKIMELIYGQGHIISLSQLYKKLFGVSQNQHSYVYIYQAMTDVELSSVSVDFIMQQLEANPELYKDFFYESGLRLRTNIFRLASNAIKDDYKKVAHQLICLSDEFGTSIEKDGKYPRLINVPLRPVDMAEQLNISVQVAEAVLASLSQSGLIEINEDKISIPDTDLLKDTYL